MTSSLFDLTGKVALVIVTKDGGIGDTQAKGLATCGADVAVAGTELSGAEVISEKVRKLDRKSAAFGVDVTQEPSVVAIVQNVLKEFPRIDILVNDFSTRIRKPACHGPLKTGHGLPR